MEHRDQIQIEVDLHEQLLVGEHPSSLLLGEVDFGANLPATVEASKHESNNVHQPLEEILGRHDNYKREETS